MELNKDLGRGAAEETRFPPRIVWAPSATGLKSKSGVAIMV